MTLVELLVATTLTMTVMGGVLAALGPAQAAFVSQADAADVRQRLRFACEAVTRDLLAATEALPFPGGILIVSGPAQRTYYARSGTLRVDDGRGNDLPVVDGVAEVAFERVEERVRVRLRMMVAGAAARDASLVFDVAPRNIGRGAMR
jgi:hypothetical protein